MFVGSAVPSAGAVYAVVDLFKVAESLEYKAILNASVPLVKLWPSTKISCLKLLQITDRDWETTLLMVQTH